MTKPYIVLVNGVLAQRTLTYTKAKKVLDNLVSRGYALVSIAYDTEGN